MANILLLLFSSVSILASDASAAGAGTAAAWSATPFNSPAGVEPGAEPRISLSPPAVSATYSTAFSSKTPLTSRALDLEVSSVVLDGYPSGRTSETLALSDEPGARIGEDVVAKPAAPWSSSIKSPTPSGRSLTVISPSQVVALAEGAGKFFARTLRAFGGSPAETVKFDLFTRQQATTPTRIFARKKESVDRSTFDPNKPIKIIIHGFLSHQGPSSGGDALKNAFLSVQDCNVITVDWSGADPREYSSAVKLAVPRVASELAVLVRALHARGAAMDDVHLVGHSLGGQIAGAVGSLVLGLGLGAVGRITGLDPAGPLFEGRDAARRLDPSDAVFVDVIHTDGGQLGYAAPTGHADFYPQGGMHVHPGCGRDVVGLCSHCLAYDYIIDAVLRPGSTVFRSCSSWQAYRNGDCQSGSNAVLGTFTDSRSRGSFYLSTDWPVREDLKKAGDMDLVGLLSIRSSSGGRDGVMVLHC